MRSFWVVTLANITIIDRVMRLGSTQLVLQPASLRMDHSPPSRLLKKSSLSAQQGANEPRKRSLHGASEHFAPSFKAVMCRPTIFQRPGAAREALRNSRGRAGVLCAHRARREERGWHIANERGATLPGGRVRGRDSSIHEGGAQPGILAGRSQGCKCPMEIRSLLTPSGFRPQGRICRVARLGPRDGYSAAPGRLASTPLWTETRLAGIMKSFPRRAFPTVCPDAAIASVTPFQTGSLSARGLFSPNCRPVDAWHPTG